MEIFAFSKILCKNTVAAIRQNAHAQSLPHLEPNLVRHKSRRFQGRGFQKVGQQGDQDFKFRFCANF